MSPQNRNPPEISRASTLNVTKHFFLRLTVLKELFNIGNLKIIVVT